MIRWIRIYGINPYLGIVNFYFPKHPLYDEELEPLPPPLYPVSRNFLKAYDFEPYECEEEHLPGDCPLCGAY